MVKIVAEEPTGRMSIGILGGITKYKKVGDSGYVRVLLKFGSKEVWMSHWGPFEELEDKYKDLQIGDRVRVFYVERDGKKGKLYKIINIAPAPEMSVKESERAEKKEPKKPGVTVEDVRKVVEKIAMELADIKVKIQQINDLLVPINDVDVPRFDERLRIIEEKLDALLEKANR